MRFRFIHAPLRTLSCATGKFRVSVFVGVASVTMMAVIGCDGGIAGFFSGQPPRDRQATSADEPGLTFVGAQGQLAPQEGVLAVMGPPGDRVAKIAVAEGDMVAAGDLLIELESLRAKKIELDVAETKLEEGRAQFQAEQASATARLQVAQAKLKQARTQVEQSRGKLKIAEGPGGSLDLLRRAAELGQRKLDQLRSASNDPKTARLVSENKLDEESLRISETRAQYEAAKVDAQDAIETAELSVAAAEQEIIAAEKSMLAAKASGSLASLEKQIELLRLYVKAAQLVSPTAGRILSIDTMPGQATTTMPLMHLADTSKMVCIAEINVADLGRIERGQTAEIESPGLARTLHGTVRRIEPMIATPAMPSPFPLAPVDRYTAKVIIEIAPPDTATAAERIEMQVNVRIFMDADNHAARDLPAGGSSNPRSMDPDEHQPIDGARST
ncbi:HlyD family efflux transporter periplasmic adaptor subunit [Allorhodopirellula heiligendammensis]|uniref:Multidrug resistance protein MdtN n=1 Tax=Allorhodopirellula heiligendammensis TaxID=2714739 RepID=A0A5C6C3V4_9BACT|nr:HlyD family efflux transporter periplasmic adaptor subunit [Allorhodopirellula heiligendammensis]TWU18291.1 multidrug resistance protein MdtN [Allorhodopirellula heiligendammensis]